LPRAWDHLFASHGTTCEGHDRAVRAWYPRPRSDEREVAGWRSGRCPCSDLPERRAHYALRDIGYLCRQADTHGASVGIYARRLLEVDLPWTRMRQVYRLLGYARRYGDHRCDTACAQALALDVVDVGLIGRILERGREHARLPDPPSAQRLPLRFARHPQEPTR